MTSSTTDPDTRQHVDRLAAHTQPYLIGVRHHSPALAAVVPALLAAARPDVLLVELPEELGEWLPHLGDPALTAPVALSGAARDGSGLAFYPFADFSPELAAVRWAHRAGVPVRPCDLPIACRDGGYRGGAAGASPLTDALRRTITGRDDEDLWDRLVEAPAPGQSPEAVRRTALAVGWAMRRDAELTGVDPYDLRREAWMRRAVAAERGRRCAAVVGSFHAAALLAGPGDPPEEVPDRGAAEIVTSLVPYGFALLDERSGYPAGIRDPEWQQAVLAAAGDPAAVEEAAATVIVAICARVRRLGHPAGPGEAREALRLAVDLARLRGLPAPGRGEVVEAVQTVLTHAEPLGRGRVVARAAGDVLVGHRTGVLAPGTPRSGLAPAVEALLAELRLPGPTSREPATMRLDPLRSPLDARRELALRRLAVLGVPYGDPTDTTGVGGADALSTRWTVTWTPATAATLPVAGLWGPTLELAAQGKLRARRATRERGDGHTPRHVLADLEDAMACGLPDVVTPLLTDAATVLPAAATLDELLTALDLTDRLRAGHLPAIPPDVLDTHPLLTEELTTAAVTQVEGLGGSTDPADARALVELAQRQDAHGIGLRLAAALRALSTEGAPMIAGAAAAVQVLLDLTTAHDLGERMASWLDNATTPDRRTTLRDSLTGVLAAASPLLEGAEAMTPLLKRVEAVRDQDFLDRLPALRGAFTSIGPGARHRVLAVVEQRTGSRVDTPGRDPELLAIWLSADRTSATTLAHHGLTPKPPTPTDTPHPPSSHHPTPTTSGSDPTHPPASDSTHIPPTATSSTARSTTDSAPTAIGGTNTTHSLSAPSGVPARTHLPIPPRHGTIDYSPLPATSPPHTPTTTSADETDSANSAPTPGHSPSQTRSAAEGKLTPSLQPGPTPFTTSDTAIPSHAPNPTLPATSGAATPSHAPAPTPPAISDTPTPSHANPTLPATNDTPTPSHANPTLPATNDTATPSHAPNPTFPATSGSGRPSTATRASTGHTGPDVPVPATDGTTGQHRPSTAPPPDPSESSVDETVELSPVVRWRLVLGRRGDRPQGAARYAAALDELYGQDRGEGAAAGDLGADRSDPFPDVREWSTELLALFGENVREEVLASAVEGGRVEAALELDPASVRPSVELLRTVLSLAGGMSEATLAALRPLVARLVRELSAQLAIRVRPALSGLLLATPTRRPSGRLDLPRTLRANLATARRGRDGRIAVVPERPVFRARGRRANDWRLVLVVDVSGSMEASTVWSALTASVFAGVPSLSTHFLAFSTEVVDLTDRVADPLSLLLEVRVGGGTHIAGALRYASSLVTVPERTMVVLVSDFEEGGPVAALLTQVRTLVSSGVTVLGCASLDDTGTARYSKSIAGALVDAGMPVAALSPLELARWVGEKVRG